MILFSKLMKISQALNLIESMFQKKLRQDQREVRGDAEFLFLRSFLLS